MSSYRPPYDFHALIHDIVDNYCRLDSRLDPSTIDENIILKMVDYEVYGISNGDAKTIVNKFKLAAKNFYSVHHREKMLISVYA
jgi:hypothetical protein